MTAFDYDALWTKSKIFIDRSVRARDLEDPTDFHLWAAVALEILGKATLARIHPTLVADPSDFASLLTAAGHTTGTNHRSITAKTLFERLQTSVPHFEERMKRDATLMANRRNAELHSGETPIEGLDERAWVPQFWRMADVLIAHQGQTLDEWVGTDEAIRVREVLRDAAELQRQTVLGRIQRRRADFDSQWPQGSDDRREVESRAISRPMPPSYAHLAEAFEDASCPSCGLKGWLFGSVGDEEVMGIEHLTDGDGFVDRWEVVRITHDVEAFRCPECGLRLEGRDEVAIAGLPSDFVRDEEREPDYEPEYGND
jgi:predicted RNA-binding Zn-ribbon protein involved in translation (DUF1610 family)